MGSVKIFVGSRDAPGVDEGEGHRVTYTPAEMRTVTAARTLSSDDVCFARIGLPSAACNLAPFTHAARINLINESGHAPDTAELVAAFDRRWRY